MSRLERLHGLTKQRNEACIAFSDRATTVSSAFLVISVSFRSDLIGTDPSSIWLLQTAWIALALTTFLGCITHLASASAANAGIVALRTDEKNLAASASPIYRVYYHVLVIAFPIGIAALVAFGTVNTHLPEPSQLKKRETANKTQHHKSDRAGGSEAK